jgi:hypothetical protein
MARAKRLAVRPPLSRSRILHRTDESPVNNEKTRPVKGGDQFGEIIIQDQAAQGALS